MLEKGDKRNCTPPINERGRSSDNWRGEGWSTKQFFFLSFHWRSFFPHLLSPMDGGDAIQRDLHRTGYRGRITSLDWLFDTLSVSRYSCWVAHPLFNLMHTSHQHLKLVRSLIHQFWPSATLTWVSAQWSELLLFFEEVVLGDQPAVVSHPGQVLKMLSKGKNFITQEQSTKGV